MQQAGAYNARLRLLAGTRTKDPTTGQDVLTHAPYGYLWCSVEETNGRRQSEFGATQTGADATIRVRNFPAVTVDDLLEDGSGVVWHIDAIHNGDNELLLDCYRHDTLQDFTIEDSGS